MRTLKQILWSAILVPALLVASASRVAAQVDVANTPGFQPGRDYFSQAPFEFHDPLTGNLLLQFTDLVLPGNAGRDLRFQRTYTLKGEYPWSFGVAGMIMEIVDPWHYGQYSNMPTLWEWARGSSQQPLPLNQPASPDDVAAYQWVVTDSFLKYDRAANRLYGPDGSISEFDWGTGTNNFHRFLTAYQDSFGNRVTFSGWGTSTLTITQSLGTDEQRVVTLQQAGTWGVGSPGLPSSMNYAGGTWSYEISGSGYWIARATPPVGSGWQYDGTFASPLTVTTPNGGTTQYNVASQYTGDDYYCDEFWCYPIPTFAIVLTDKTVGGRDLPAAHWHYEYQLDQSHWPEQRGLSHQSVVTGPTGQPDQTTTTYVYGCLPISGCTDPSYYVSNGYGLGLSVGRLALLTSRTLESPVGTVLETDSRTYQGVGIRGYWCYCSLTPNGIPELNTRTIVRTGRSYQTTYEYRSSDYGDYHQPSTITETGDLSRTTTRTYEHHDTLPPTPYIVGLLSNETVTANGESFTKSSQYIPTTGFMTRETIFGIVTDFAPDTCGTSSGSCGNVASVTHNGHTTSSTYSYGLLKNTTLPNGDTIAREIDQNSSNGRPVVTKVTRAGRATTFEFDDLFRIRYVHPPGGTTVIETQYDNAGGAWVKSLRGPSVTQTNLDGFGRPRCTIKSPNVLNIQACTEYDANGRKSRDSLPASGTPTAYTTFSYDGLGRLTQRTNPDSTAASYTYGSTSDGLTIAIQDENTHVTMQVRQGFGDPDDARLARVTDAVSHTWSYTYNALGNLTCVQVPAGNSCPNGFRTWSYDSSNRLSVETQPESGTATYTYSSGTTLVQTKTDANQTVFTYTYDDNDRLKTASAHMAAWPTGQYRVTSLTYEVGSDNRQSATVADGHDGSRTDTLFSYEVASGRLSRLRDIVNNTAFVDRLFSYNNLDQLSTLTYPSGRRVSYDYNSEGQITVVCTKDGNGICLPGATYASAFTYHPSGAPLQYTGANGLIHKFDFDSSHYWLQSIRTCVDANNCGSTSTPLLKLDYAYDNTIGNVMRIDDNSAQRGTAYRQDFAYDALDRLTTTTGFGYYPSSCFGYDARGNRTTACGTSYTYDANDRLTNQSGVAFTYDAHGNLLGRSSPATTFTYTPDNLIATVSGGVSYQYDADGQRVLTSGPGAAYKYAARGPGGQLLSDWDGSAANDYIYAGSRLIAIVRITGGSWGGSGGGPPVPPTCSGVTFTDNPLLPGATLVKAVHAGELRVAIDATRSRYGLSAYAWSGALTAGTTIVQASQITEMRTALAAVYAAADRPLTWYTDPTLVAGVTIKAAHFTELRGAVCALP